MKQRTKISASQLGQNIFVVQGTLVRTRSNLVTAKF